MTPLSRELESTLEPLLGPEGEMLSAGTLDRLRQIVAGLASPADHELVLAHLKSLPFHSGIHTGRVYLEGRLALERSDLVASDLIFQPLCEKLNQAESWEVLSSVALEWLEGAGSKPAARYLVRAWRKGGVAAAGEEAFRRAHAVLPEDAEINWCLGTILEEGGSSREGRRVLARALKPLADQKEVDRVEEAVIRLLEAPEGSILIHCVEAVESLAHHGEGTTAAALFDGLVPALVSHGLAPQAWQAVRRIMERHPTDTAWRPLAVTVLKEARRDLASLDRMIEVSGIGRLAVPANQALAVLDQVLPFAPGFYVEHSGWGLGEIKDNDGEFLTISFPARPAHRMNLKSAAQVLASLPADDLKVQIAVNKPGLVSLVSADPVAVIVMALKRAGGEASSAELRKLLVPAVILTTEWSAWFKKTKERLASDPRVDSRQAFRDFYRIPAPGLEVDDETPLPDIDEPKGIDHNIDVLHQFLEHHPGQEDELREAMLDRVRRWAERRTAGSHERARARLLLHRWEEAGRAGHEAAIHGFFEEEFDLSRAGDADEQMKLLALGLAGPARAGALTLGLNARMGPVREKALEALLEAPGDEPVEFMGRLLENANDNIEALFLAVEKVAERSNQDDPRLDRLLWPGIFGLLDLLNATGREPLRKKGLKYFDPDSHLMDRVREWPPDERTELNLTSRLRDWRASDKILFPILEALTACGLDAVVQSVHQKRAAAHAKLFQGTADPDDIQVGPVVMTRHTFQTLHAELERVNLELKTTIPQAIRKARELGDLRENAEYEAAKLKQANYSKRLAQLDKQLEKVRILEDLAIEEGKAGPGTMVTVREEAGGAESTYWLLGEGDHEYGAGVISYRAALGRALTGRRAGDVIDYAAPEGARKLRITSVQTRKPTGPPGS